VSAAIACGTSEQKIAPIATLPWSAGALPEIVVPGDNASNDAKIDLGRMLFHDPLLSSDRTVACVTCHSQYWGMSDGLPRSIGVGGVGPVGLGRTGPTHARRNARTLWNAAYRRALFWDGRAATLEDQVLVPMGDAVELGRAPADVVVDLSANADYRARFVAAFGGDDAVSVVNVQRAIASFVRTVVSVDAPYDRYARGDANALAADEVRGMNIFADLGCASCHAPPLFESERYENVGIASDPSAPDDGRFEITHVDADRGAFRVPTLRNLRATGPYFHDGSSATIDDAAARMARFSAPSRTLSADELASLVAFLRSSLVDRSHEPTRPDAVPSGLPLPVDGFRISR
jgi:cytochrome c peroxidase